MSSNSDVVPSPAERFSTSIEKVDDAKLFFGQDAVRDLSKEIAQKSDLLQMADGTGGQSSPHAEALASSTVEGSEHPRAEPTSPLGSSSTPAPIPLQSEGVLSPFDRLVAAEGRGVSSQSSADMGFGQSGGQLSKVPTGFGHRYELPKKRSTFSLLDFCILLLFFITPLVVGTAYFAKFATDQYVSEFRFNVVDTSSSSNLVGGLASMVGAGLGSTTTENYTVADYIISPQAVIDVQKKLPIKDYFSTPSADWWARLSPKASPEKLYIYWQTMVYADYDPVTGIASARVRAFSSEDAYKISTTLLESAEALVNNMQTRRYSDSVRFAQIEVDKAEKKLEGLRQLMLNLRNDSNVVDPTTSAVTENITLATTLRLQLTQNKAELAMVLSSAPKAPQVKSLRDKISGVEKQLAEVNKEISSKGTSRKLSKMVGAFEELSAKQNLALSELTGDLGNLVQARAAADAQHIYLMSYVLPTKPFTSTYPDRKISILLVCLVSLGLLALVKIISIVMRSHAV